MRTRRKCALSRKQDCGIDVTLMFYLGLWTGFLMGYGLARFLQRGMGMARLIDSLVPLLFGVFGARPRADFRVASAGLPCAFLRAHAIWLRSYPKASRLPRPRLR